VSDMRWAISLDTSSPFDTLWHPALLSKLSAQDIQSQLHTWLTDFLSSRSQCMALTRILSSPLRQGWSTPMQYSVHTVILFLIFINYLSLENPFYLFPDDSILCRDIPHTSDRQAATSSFSSVLEKKNHKLVKHLEYGFKSWQISNSHYLSPNGPSGKPSHLLS